MSEEKMQVRGFDLPDGNDILSPITVFPIPYKNPQIVGGQVM